MEKKKYYGGTLNINRAKTNEKAPDLKGDMELSPEQFQALVDLAETGKPITLWVSAWVRNGRDGKFYSLAFDPKKPKGGGEYKKRSNDDLDDLIPF